MKNFKKGKIEQLIMFYQVNLDKSDMNHPEYRQGINGYYVPRKPKSPIEIPGQIEKYLEDPDNYDPGYDNKYKLYLQQDKKLRNVRLLQNSRIKICYRYKMYVYHVCFGWASDLNVFEQMKQGINGLNILKNRFNYGMRQCAGYNPNPVMYIRYVIIYLIIIWYLYLYTYSFVMLVLNFTKYNVL